MTRAWTLRLLGYGSQHVTVLRKFILEDGYRPEAVRGLLGEVPGLVSAEFRGHSPVSSGPARQSSRRAGGLQTLYGGNRPYPVTLCYSPGTPLPPTSPASKEV
jgi:hypothetical protein